MKLSVRSRGRCPREMDLPLCSDSVFPIALTQLLASHSFWSWLDQKAEACLPGMTNDNPQGCGYSRLMVCLLKLSGVFRVLPRGSLNFSSAVFICHLCPKQGDTMCNAYRLRKMCRWSLKMAVRFMEHAYNYIHMNALLKAETGPYYLCFACFNKKKKTHSTLTLRM